MTATNQFAAHVGLDWADKKHDVCVQFKNGERVFHVIEHTAEALDAWLTELHQKVKGRIAIALELKVRCESLSFCRYSVQRQVWADC
ncbi:hypothetical protein PEC301645_06540 [Pectobacterium carotovorum subsp. carotovorum]|nr:hypothetical protein PEC301645_06540 [Pectobacterium carotovorum subsp. carotovorum]